MIQSVVAGGVSGTITGLGIISGIIGLAGFIGALLAYVRFKGLEQSMDMMQIANSELRAELLDEKERRAKLEGQVEVLVGSLADRIVAAVAIRVGEMQFRSPQSRTRHDDLPADRTM